MIYTKTDAIGGQIFSDCRVIELNGCQISNPTAEMIAEAGWTVYVPPVVPPQPRETPDEMEVVDAMKRMLATDVEAMSDADALAVAALFPVWADRIGTAVTAGERLWYDGKLWKALQAHTAQADWTPDTAVSLYVEVSVAEWPEYRQPTGAHDAYNAGDKVTFQGQHYICQLDGTTFSPAEYPAAWKLVE